MDITLAGYKKELELELESILRYWMDNTLDAAQGGFFGRIGEEGKVYPEAPKGVVLNSRILWTFSAAYRHTRDSRWLPVAKRAYEYILAHFIDTRFGGVFWSVDHLGAMLDGRKQIYGLAFCLYGLSEYYLATGDQPALEEAITLFRLIERYSYDPRKKGYYEAFTREWRQPEDLRLSPKDANEQKTMNTHLHILEAYANLYRVWPDNVLKDRIAGLLDVFTRHIVDVGTGHLVLFFNEDWEPRSSIVSYGHDIEAAWLLQEAADIAGDPWWKEKTKQLAIQLATAAAKGLDDDGGLWYEREGAVTIREKHSWPQAEAMIGFLNAWQNNGDRLWLERSLASWIFVKEFIKDPLGGEWFWGVRQDHSPMPGQDKAGFWKCPYHNSRACLEIIRRLGDSA
jgi:cellobiose epimerase